MIQSQSISSSPSITRITRRLPSTAKSGASAPTNFFNTYSSPRRFFVEALSTFRNRDRRLVTAVESESSSVPWNVRRQPFVFGIVAIDG